MMDEKVLPAGTEVQLIDRPIVGRHSEMQVLLTMNPGDELDIELKPADESIALILTGIDGDISIHRAVLVKFNIQHPEIQPHEAYLTPAVFRIVNQNFQDVQPFVTVDSPAVFYFKNVSSDVVDVEIVLGLKVADIFIAEEYRTKRRIFRW